MTKYCRDIDENSSFLSQTSSSSQANWIQLHRPIYEEDEDEVEEYNNSQDEGSLLLKGELSKIKSENEKFSFIETSNQDSMSPANVIIHTMPINEQDSSSPISTNEHDETSIGQMDVNQADKNKWTALHWSSFKGEYSKCFDLISRGADVNLPDEHGFSPLFVAARRGHLDIIQLLLESGADVHRRNYEGKTAINMAKEKKFVQVKFL